MRERRRLAQAAWPSFALGLVGLALVVGAYDSRGVDRMLPHGYCYTWQPSLLITHVVADGLIGLAYVSIPVTLMTFVRRRTDIPFNWIGVLFALFIITCGLTHFMEIWTIWYPDYWLSGTVKALCAAVSLPTAAVLVYLLPQLLNLPTAQQMTRTLQALEREVAARREAEQALRVERDDLERRVQERTAALEASTHAELLARARAEAANEAKDRFLASVSHELRTPMQATQGWAQVLALQASLPPDVRRAVDRLQNGIRAQARIVDDLLDLSRIVSGKLEVALDIVPADDVIERAVDSVRHRAEARGVSIEITDRHCGPVHADPERLHQVLSNLIVNAVHASTAGQAVRVACTQRAGRLRIEVADQGMGIDPAEIAALFEPFRQGPAQAKGGLGLGLPISRSLVREMGGTLQAHSAGRGQGAVFAVELPAAEHGAAAQPTTGAPVGTAAWESLRRRLDGARVLYVEDDVAIREPTVVFLKGLGLSVEDVATADDAERAVLAGDFDILVCDLGLGGPRTGLDVVRLLRATAHARPALAVSARGMAQDIAASLAAGFDAHLTKPLDGLTLATRMADLLSHVRPRH